MSLEVVFWGEASPSQQPGRGPAWARTFPQATGSVWDSAGRDFSDEEGGQRRRGGMACGSWDGLVSDTRRSLGRWPWADLSVQVAAPFRTPTGLLQEQSS